MPPASHSLEREEEHRLNTRTLTIASVASATAAAVTSQLWIAGTWIAAAATPVLVALISEALHRPTERVARAWTADRDARARNPRAQTPTRGEPAAVTGSAGPMRVYRQTTRGVTEPERGGSILSGRRIPWRAVLVTAATAFAIAVAVITTVDLVSGGSVGKGTGRSTFFGGSRSSGSSDQMDTTQPKPQPKPQPRQQSPNQQQNRPSEQQPTTREPAPEEPPPTNTAPVPAPSESPPGEPVPQTSTSP
jgi:hypothetical protein